MQRDPDRWMESASGARHGHMDGQGDDVGQIMQIERGVVRDSALLRSNGQPGSDDLLEPRRRIVAEAIESTADALKTPAVSMMRERAPTDTMRGGLRRREVPRLSRGKPVE